MLKKTTTAWVQVELCFIHGLVWYDTPRKKPSLLDELGAHDAKESRARLISHSLREKRLPCPRLPVQDNACEGKSKDARVCIETYSETRQRDRSKVSGIGASMRHDRDGPRLTMPLVFFPRNVPPLHVDTLVFLTTLRGGDTMYVILCYKRHTTTWQPINQPFLCALFGVPFPRGTLMPILMYLTWHTTPWVLTKRPLFIHPWAA